VGRPRVRRGRAVRDAGGPAGVPAALHGADFLETNVRTYAPSRAAGRVLLRSGVIAAAVKAARWGWGLPYFHATMSIAHDGETIEYDTRRRDRRRLVITSLPARPDARASAPTFEYFLLERYLLFSLERQRVFAGQVHHVPYPAQEVEVAELEDQLVAAAGLPAPSRPYDAVHYAAGVDVEVFGPWPVS
jgi:uncharacterized protein YqjF (DUF2071 family)